MTDNTLLTELVKESTYHADEKCGQLSEFVRISRYAPYNKMKKRRMTWEEQVNRVFDDMHSVYYADKIVESTELKEYIAFAKENVLYKNVLGSQRALQFAGPAILRKHARMYNCAAGYINSIKSVQDVMYLLLCGCGVGTSVQKHHINQLPDIAPVSEEKSYIVSDSIEGWSDAIGVLLSSYAVDNQTFPEYKGKFVNFDYTNIRPLGARISFMNGKAPGPIPLNNAIEKIRKVIINCISLGFNKLRPIDMFDIIMHSADAVIAGGVRRSAIITIFSLDDNEMMNAKTGSWYIENPQRGRSNNSVLLLRDTPKEKFIEIMNSTKQFGEPGFIWADSTETLFNPCVEVSLYGVDEYKNTGFQMCNLCEINMKNIRTRDDFFKACIAASIIGTLQAGYTNFEYLGEVTERIVRREALLGVSMTGMMDNPNIAFDPDIQSEGADIVKRINKIIAKLIGINPAARTTCIKPAGSTSCLLETASGIHPYHSEKGFRRVQCNNAEGALEFFRNINPDAVEASLWSANGNDSVITFLYEAPASAIVKRNISAIELLEKVKLTQRHWVTGGRDLELCVQPYLNHNVSNTITVREGEWEAVADHIYENRENYAGISLLSETGDKDYMQAPFQAVYSHIQLTEMYGPASVFASGLIIHALQAFNNNLYAACDCFLGYGENLEAEAKLIDDLTKQMEKKLWVMRAEKFSIRYFNGDKKNMTYCLKDVDAWKKWCDLNRTYKNVPWNEFTEEQDNTTLEQYVACSGGQCSVIYI